MPQQPEEPPQYQAVPPRHQGRPQKVSELLPTKARHPGRLPRQIVLRLVGKHGQNHFRLNTKRQFTPIQARRIATSMRPCEALKNNLIPVITNARLISIKPYRAHRFPLTVLCTVAYHQKRLECCECCQIICWLERHSQTMDL